MTEGAVEIDPGARVETKITTVKEGPKITSLSFDGRNNEIQSSSGERFSEKKGLKNLLDFIDTAITTAKEAENPGMEEKAKEFTEAGGEVYLTVRKE